MSCCPRFLTLCHTNCILHGTEISGTEKAIVLLKCAPFKPCDTSTTRGHRRKIFFCFKVLGGNIN